MHGGEHTLFLHVAPYKTAIASVKEKEKKKKEGKTKTNNNKTTTPGKNRNPKMGEDANKHSTAKQLVPVPNKPYGFCGH